MSSTESAVQLSKRQLRQLVRARRRALRPGEQRRAAFKLAQRAQRQPWYIRARSLVLYMAADGEIDPRVLMRQALAQGKRVYLPQLCRDGSLLFGEYRAGMRLRRNCFGIAEPVLRRKVSLLELDVVLLPLVAFDRSGNRLGMGGGFYDRTFARWQRIYTSRANAPRLIGLAHGFQQVDNLASQSWDVPLSGVLTDADWLSIVSRS
ncbi:MAG TPA: 5-formyltetrahydrofolate cyclo-ligase [Spongiibacteraceae bacterium]|nr:5-formyltetrahydrofolate cyclo-ligase [Spongiibacteraceae bacterium]